MEALEKAIAMISAASGADTAAVAERLESDATAESIATEFFEPKYKAQRDQGHKIATDKTRKAVETALKAAGVEDASFDALPAALETLQGKAAAANPAALTPEQLLKQKPVVDALNAERLKIDTAVADAEKRVRGELETERQAFERQRTEVGARTYVKGLLKELNPNYTPGKEAAQEERLVREILNEGNFKLDDKGEPQLVDADGGLLPGKLGSFVKVADFVREKAEEVHGLPLSTPRQSADLTPEQQAAALAAEQGKGGFKHFTGAAPATEEEYLKLANDPAQKPEAVQELRAFWKTKAG